MGTCIIDTNDYDLKNVINVELFVWNLISIKIKIKKMVHILNVCPVGKYIRMRI